MAIKVKVLKTPFPFLPDMKEGEEREITTVPPFNPSIMLQDVDRKGIINIIARKDGEERKIVLLSHYTMAIFEDFERMGFIEIIHE